MKYKGDKAERNVFKIPIESEDILNNRRDWLKEQRGEISWPDCIYITIY